MNEAAPVKSASAGLGPAASVWPWKPWQEALALFALPFALYAEAYGFGLLGLDDVAYYHANRTLKGGLLEGLAGIWDPFYSESFPVTQFTYWLDLALFGSQSWWGARAHELAWFGLGTLAVHALVLRLSGRRGLALAVAGLYAVHPVCASSVLWLANRKTVVALALSLWSMERYVAARSRETPRARWEAGTAAWLLFVLALCSKPHAVALPGMLLAYELTLGQGSWRRRAAWLAPFALAAGLFAGLSLLGQTRHDLDNPYLGNSPLAAWVSSGPVVLRYLAHTVAPLKLSFFYAVPELPAASPWGWGAWLALGLLLAALVWIARARAQAACGLLLGLAALVPVLNLVPQPIPMTDHYLLWALPGWLWCLCLLADERIPRTAASPALRARVFLAAGAGLVCALLALARVPAFHSPIALFGEAARREPDSALAWGNYAFSLSKSSDANERVQADKASLHALACPDQSRLLPFYRARFVRDLAIHQHHAGQPERAQELVRRELDRYEDGPPPAIPYYRNARAEIALRTGRPREALELLAGDFTEAHAKAAAALRERCRDGQVLPAEVPAQGLIQWTFGDEFDKSEAQPVLFRVLRIQAVAWRELGDLERAFDVAALLVHLAPEDPDARLVLAKIYRDLGLPQTAEKLERRHRP